MFAREGSLLSRALTPHLQEELDRQKAEIVRVTDPALLMPGLAQERIKPIAVPELLRDEVQFDVHENGDEVVVRVKVPVTGDVELLECVPQGQVHLNIRVRITDDLLQGGDGEGARYSSDTISTPSPSRRSGFVLSKAFPGGATTDEVRGWARGLLDQIESCLPAVRDQVAAHHDHAQHELAECAEARRQALATAHRLEEELGRGV